MENPNAPNKVSTLTSQEPKQTKPGNNAASQVNVTTTSLPREEPPAPPEEKWRRMPTDEPPKRSSMGIVLYRAPGGGVSRRVFSMAQ